MAEYAYRIKHNKGSFIHLLQNGKYLSVPSFPLTPETTSPIRSGATSRATIPFQSSIREICATPFHPLRSPRVRPSMCSTRSISLLSHVSLSSLSHPATGTYAAAAEAVEYLAHLGVAAVRVLSLEPHVCDAGSTIDARCWRSLPRSLPHRQPRRRVSRHPPPLLRHAAGARRATAVAAEPRRRFAAGCGPLRVHGLRLVRFRRHRLAVRVRDALRQNRAVQLPPASLRATGPGDRLRGAPAGGDVSASVRGDNRV